MKNSGRLIIGIAFFCTLLVGWFAWSAYREAPRVAAENLRGAGLSIAAAIEQLAAVDDGFKSLAAYQSPDIAYFRITDRQGIIRYHTNKALIGLPFDPGGKPETFPNGVWERRDRLGTGEEVFLLGTRIHPRQSEYQLTLALHTYRADNVIRRARTGVSVVTALVAILWGVTMVVLVMMRREERHRREMQRKEELARLGEMGAVMAHEIRNPLAGIKGFAQLIESAEDLQQSHRHAEKIVAQSLRLEHLVDELLSFAREEHEERRVADLAVLVEDCANLLRKEAGEAGVSIRIESRDEVTVCVAVERIVQMVLNLMKNAIQAMPDGGEILVATMHRARRARIVITDTGTGIAGENLPRIFEPFWTSKSTGTGLGLALCRKVVEAHGGSIAVESSVGQGTTFTVELPASA